MCVVHRDISLGDPTAPLERCDTVRPSTGHKKLKPKMKILERCQAIGELLHQVSQIAQEISDAAGAAMIHTIVRITTAKDLCVEAARRQLIDNLPFSENNNTSNSTQPPPPSNPWSRWVDQASGRVYWHNADTHESTWIDPSSPPPPPPF